MISGNARQRTRDGERLEQRRRTYSTMVKGFLFGVGMVSGAAIGFHVASNDLAFDAPWPPALALGVAALYLVALAFGTFALDKSMDEFEKARSYKAVAFAGATFLVIYPVWFLLWKGGVAVEPIHWVLFVTFWLALAGGSLFYRFR